MAKIAVTLLTQCSLFYLKLQHPLELQETLKHYNIYYNKPLNNIFSENLSSIISDHLIQFLIEPLDSSEKSSKVINKQRCYKNFDKLKFKGEFVKVNWDGFCLTSDPSRG